MDNNYKVKYIKTKHKVRKIITYNSDKKKEEHEFIAHKLSKIFTPSIFSKGYVEKESIYTNAYAHLYNDVFIKLDIKDFFNSINHKLLKKIIYHELYEYITPSDVDKLIKMCTVSSRGLPLGLKTSPILSNIYLKPFDIQLYNKLKRLKCDNIIYTRYADDMVISFKKIENHKEIEKEILSIIDALVQQYHHKINNKKTKIVNFENTAQVRITGVSIVNKQGRRRLSIGRNQKRKFFYEVINVKKNSNIEKNYKCIQSLKGKLSFYLSIEKEEFDSFLTENMKKEIHELGYDNFIDLVKTL